MAAVSGSSVYDLAKVLQGSLVSRIGFTLGSRRLDLEVRHAGRSSYVNVSSFAEQIKAVPSALLRNRDISADEKLCATTPASPRSLISARILPGKSTFIPLEKFAEVVYHSCADDVQNQLIDHLKDLLQHSQLDSTVAPVQGTFHSLML